MFREGQDIRGLFGPVWSEHVSDGRLLQHRDHMLAASRLVARLNWLRWRGGLMGDIIKPSEEGIHYMQTEGHFDVCLTCKEKLAEGYNGLNHWAQHIKLVFLDWAVHQSHSNRDAGGRADLCCRSGSGVPIFEA